MLELLLSRIWNFAWWKYDIERWTPQFIRDSHYMVLPQTSIKLFLSPISLWHLGSSKCDQMRRQTTAVDIFLKFCLVYLFMVSFYPTLHLISVVSANRIIWIVWQPIDCLKVQQHINERATSRGWCWNTCWEFGFIAVGRNGHSPSVKSV